MNTTEPADPKLSDDVLAVRFRMSPEEYLGAQRVFCRYFASAYARFNYRYPVPVGILLLVDAALVFALLANIWLCLFLAVFGAYLILWKTIVGPWRLKRQFSKSAELTNDQTLAFAEKEIAIQTLHSRGEIEWGRFARFIETDALFVVFGKPRTLLIVPKRVFSAGEIDRFRDLLKRKLPGTRRSR